jgi:hypothetical protein
MDHYEGVVFDYLRADRRLFLNTEFCLQPNPTKNPEKAHWFLDALVVNVGAKQAFLVEITFAEKAQRLRKKLADWREHWPAILKALARDAHLTEEWQVRPWLFLPERQIKDLVGWPRNFGAMNSQHKSPAPRITPLEMTQPWCYRWNGIEEKQKPGFIPPEMCA